MAKKRFTVKASIQGIKIAENALLRLNYGTKTEFVDAKRLARSSVTNFFNLKPIQLHTFKNICENLKLDYQKIIDLSDDGLETENTSPSPRIDSHPQTPTSEESVQNANYNPPDCIRLKIQEKFSPSSIIVERSNYIEQIVNRLLNAQGEQSNNIIALWGPGGCGKTVLALMACCLPEVMAHFQGGIFWVDLEEGEDIVEGMKTLYKQSIGSEPIFNTAADIATIFLNKWKNEHEPRLIVLDNLQTYKPLEQFLSSRYQYCSWLITTRNLKSFAKQSSVEAIQIDTLQFDEATLLLYEDLKKLKKGDKIDSEKLEELVSQLYEWPLLFNFVKEEIYFKIKCGNKLDNAIHDILEDIKENDWNFYWDRISENFEISIKCLTEVERKRLEELVVFPTNIPIPLSVIAKLWNLKITLTIQLCEHLYSLSLLQRYDANRKTIYMNNILRQYLLQNEEIRERRSKIHKKLLGAYENFNTTKTILSNLPDEDSEEEIYFKRFYQYHLKLSAQKMPEPDDKSPLPEIAKEIFKTELEMLWEEYNLRIAKLKALRKRRIIETDANEKFKLEIQVKEEEEEIEKLKHKL
ncbi:NB-ARC domain-containing protein [Nostoc sp.]|uniref:NB-ARC domain-containing protein n=1 Tax=Nostoc sp. TaxID=1180 RepID=UPI003593325C